MRAALMRATALALLASAASAEVAERPDETALRYYAAQAQRERVEAETDRLRRRHPGWQPPADLWNAKAGGEDEDGFWDLHAAGRSAELNAALAARARTEPGWKPSPALQAAIDARALREEVMGLTKAGRWQDLATLAAKHRAEVEAGDAEVVWAVAEAFGRTERQPEALALLRAAFSTGRFSPEERRVSLLRAMRVLPMAEIDRLAALGSAPDLEPIRVDLARGRISAELHDEAGQAASSAELAAFAAYAEASGDADQAALVAWHAFKRRDLPGALAWFKRSMSRGGDAMVAHGLAHTLRLLGLRRDAEEVAYAWREPLVNNALLFIDLLEADLTREAPPAVEPERLKRYAEVTLAQASGEGAQALGWYAYNNCQFDTALGWFRRAVAWFPKEATVTGYALSLRRMRQERAFVEVVNRYDGLFPKVVDLLFQASGDRPMACEVPAPRAQKPAAPASAYLNLAPVPEPAGAARRGRVPSPDKVALAPKAAPAIRRSDFPIAVQLENDLRAAPSGGAVPEPRWGEHPVGRAPTVARRVPGVGPMPYERFGFALLPSWNGIEGASVPGAAERPAPEGTLWADERAGAVASGRSPAAQVPRRADPSETGTLGGTQEGRDDPQDEGGRDQALRNPFVRKISP